MSIEVSCNCGARFLAKPELAGHNLTCPTCGGPLHVPALTPLGPVDPAPLDAWVNYSENDPLAYSPPVRRYKARKPMSADQKQAIRTALMLVGGLAAAAGVIALAVFLIMSAGSLFGARYGSPQAVFEAQRKATIAEDWSTFFGTMTEDSQVQLVNFLAMMVSAGAVVDEDLESIAKKHGVQNSGAMVITPGGGSNMNQMFGQMHQNAAAIGAKVKNKRGFFVDVMTFMQTKSRHAQANNPLGEHPMKSAQLVNVVIDGDTAHGQSTMTLAGRQQSVPIRFRKVKNCWLIDMVLLNTPAQSTTINHSTFNSTSP